MKFKFKFCFYFVGLIVFFFVFFRFLLPFIMNPLGLPERVRPTGSIEESKSNGAFLWEYHVAEYRSDDDSLQQMVQMKEVYLEKERWWRPSHRDYVVVDSTAVLVMCYGDVEREPLFAHLIFVKNITPDLKWSSVTNYGRPIPPATLLYAAKRDSTERLRDTDTIKVVFYNVRDRHEVQMTLAKVRPDSSSVKKE